MKIKKEKLSKLTSEVKTTFTKNKPAIFTGIGIASAFGMTILAVKSTPKALRLMEEERVMIASKDEECEPEDVDLTPKEVFLATWKCYIPAAVLGIISVSFLIEAQNAERKRSAAAIAAYKLYESTLSEYKSKVARVISDKKEQSLMETIVDDKIQENPPVAVDVISTGQGTTLCYENICGRYFRHDISKIKTAINEANTIFLNEGYISLNRIYEEIGLPRCGLDMGWRYEGTLLPIVERSSLAENDEPCYVIYFSELPVFNYERYI